MGFNGVFQTNTDVDKIMNRISSSSPSLNIKT
jgi:hypothetical protein